MEEMDDNDLLSALEDAADPSGITELRHVRSQSEIRAAEEIAKRENCDDFDRFRPLFEQAERELNSGLRQTRPFGKDASVDTGNFFILGGQSVYVAEKGDEVKAPNGLLMPDVELFTLMALNVIFYSGLCSVRSIKTGSFKLT